MKKVITLFLCLACIGSFAQAKVLQKSDKMVPRWVKHTPQSPRSAIYQYRVVQVYVDNLNEVPQKSLQELTNYLPYEWGVTKATASTMRNNTSAGNAIEVVIDSEGSKVNEVPMHCRMIDTYWERVQMGYQTKYRCYVLYQMAQPPYQANEDAYVTDKYGFGAVALSIIPGAGQMYKGSYLKGGLIMGASVLCAGGIVLCESNKAGYQALANKEHNASKKKTYQNNANNWGTGSYICIGALGALWIYNLIDAGVASGAKRIKINKYATSGTGCEFHLEPSMIDYQTPALTARITF
jgi:hypothetical protein